MTNAVPDATPPRRKVSKKDRDLTIPEGFLKGIGHPASVIPTHGPIRSDDGQVVVAYHCANACLLRGRPPARYWSSFSPSTRGVLESCHQAGGTAYVLFLAGVNRFAIPWRDLRDFRLHQGAKAEGLLILEDWDGAHRLTGQGKGVRLDIEHFRLSR